MIESLKITAKKTLQSFGIYDPVRNFYFRAKFFNSKSSLEVLGTRRVFWTPSLSMHNRIVDAGGEKQQLEEFIKHIKAGDTVWDIGSYIGMFAIYACHAVGHEGNVYAFEPEPRSYNLLLRNCRLNNTMNLKVINAALSDKNDKGFIFPSDKSHQEIAIHSLRPGNRLAESGSPVNLLKGDTLVEDRKILAPNIIKLDVEGAECQVMNGMLNILARPECRFLIMEVHPESLPSFGNSLQDVRSLLSRSGFSIAKEVSRGAEMHYICIK